MSVYLTDTIRSRSFSLPQRIEPARASWLCFAPHPPLGFRPPEPFPLSQPVHLSMPSALLPFRPTPTSARVAPSSIVAPTFTALPQSPEVRKRIVVFARATLSNCLGIYRTSSPPKRRFHSESGQNRRPGVSTKLPQRRIRVRERSVGDNSGRHVPTTSERCSD